MMPYFSNVAPPSEPEGWDAIEILELENPVTKRWSCPAMTLRNRRCENVVSQDRSIKVKDMINAMAIDHAAVIVRDENRELTNLAEAMLCHRHRGVDKIRGAVALWKNCIKTSMRLQAWPPAVRYTPQAPATAFQPSGASSGPQRQHIYIPSEGASTMPDVQIRTRSRVLDTPSPPTQSPTLLPTPLPTPPTPPPSSSTHGATFDAVTLRHLMSEFSRLNQEVQTLKDTNRRLRAENTQLLDNAREAAAEHRRTAGELGVADEERGVLTEQVDDQYREINRLREREDRHLRRIAALELEDAVGQSCWAHCGRDRASAGVSVVPEKGDEDE